LQSRGIAISLSELLCPISTLKTTPNKRTLYRVQERERLQSKEYQRQKRASAALGAPALAMSQVHDLYNTLRKELNEPQVHLYDTLLNDIAHDNVKDEDVFWTVWEPNHDAMRNTLVHPRLKNMESTEVIRQIHRVYLRDEIDEAQERILQVRHIVSLTDNTPNQMKQCEALLDQWRIVVSPIEARRRRMMNFGFDDLPDNLYTRVGKVVREWVSIRVFNYVEAIIALQQGCDYFVQEVSAGRLRGLPLALPGTPEGS
jgi:hypothetical protein